MRVEINLNFSTYKYGLKMYIKSESGITLCISCTVNSEFIQFVHKETGELQLTINHTVAY